MIHKRILLILVIILLTLAACNGDDKDEGQIDAQKLLNNAATQLDEVGSFELELSKTGAPTYLDVSPVMEGIVVEIVGAYGYFVAPDRIGGTVSIKLEDVPTSAEITAIGDKQYVKHRLLTGDEWIEEFFAIGFNPTSLQAADSGIGNALRSIKNAEYIEKTDLDGIEAYHIRGTIDAALVNAITVGLMGMKSGEVEIEVFIRTDNQRLERVVLTEPPPETNPDADEGQWTVNLYEYNGDFKVEQPEIE